MERQLTPEELEATRNKLLTLPVERRELLYLQARAKLARDLPIGAEGFGHFYYCVWRRELQPYAIEWVKAFAAGEWTILECFRGSGKSTDLSISFMAYCLGKEPWTSVLIIQANDDTASKTTSLVASIIKHYQGWKLCFPNVIPDDARGWGAKGYFVKDVKVCGTDDSNYGAWLEMCARDHMKDPSLVGAGVFSADIVGMHPRRLLFDDIHDQTNSVFPRERQKVVDTVRANVLPVITKPGDDRPFIGIACTPWDEDDAYHVLYNTGLFKKHVTPILVWDDDGKHELDGRRCNLTWEDGFTIEQVRQLRTVNSKAEFARMYLCDLSEAKAKLYKWFSYDALDIDWKMPLVTGVDYASVYTTTTGREGGRSHFAMAYALRLPMGGAVVGDGIVEQVSQSEAEIAVLSAQNRFQGFQTSVIEMDGVGAQFIQLLSRNPRMLVTPMKTSQIYRGAKKDRQYAILSPLLERAALRVSNADTKFLNTFRSYLENYPNLDQHAPEWDVADAVVLAVMGIPGIYEQAAIITGEKRFYGEPEEEQPSPWNSLAKEIR